MAPKLWMALALIALWPGQALASPAPAPDLDCSMGFEGLHKWAAWLPGARQTNDAGGHEVFTVSDPNVWRVEITFTEQGQPGHPSVVLRKFLKQVTGVWTAQSKACGFGDKAQFSALMAAMRAEDTRLTNASRADVERQKREQSPLAP